MNRIYWDKDSIGLMTSHINAVSHSHPVMQLFLSLNEKLDIEILNELYSCECIVVNKNIPHSFQAKDNLYFSLLIEPTSIIAEQLQKQMKDSYFLIYDNKGSIAEIQQQANYFLHNHCVREYKVFLKQLLKFLDIEITLHKHDDKINDLLLILNNCDCDTHSISNFASKLSLSESRLSHLFKKQTGVSLKTFLTFHQLKRVFTELLNGKSITESALIAGFDSPSHFASTTKRILGMSATLSLKDSELLNVFEP